MGDAFGVGGSAPGMARGTELAVRANDAAARDFKTAPATAAPPAPAAVWPFWPFMSLGAFPIVPRAESVEVDGGAREGVVARRVGRVRAKRCLKLDVDGAGGLSAAAVLLAEVESTVEVGRGMGGVVLKLEPVVPRRRMLRLERVGILRKGRGRIVKEHGSVVEGGRRCGAGSAVRARRRDGEGVVACVDACVGAQGDEVGRGEGLITGSRRRKDCARGACTVCV